MWDDSYTSFAKTHFRCEGNNTIIHSLPQIKQIETKHKKGCFDDMTFDDSETQVALNTIYNEFTKIKNESKKNIFIWFHLPHVMRGRQGYGSDIDVLDKVVGFARELFGDDDIFVSADHGHMDGWKGKYHYGYDVDEEAACIPLIAPRINNTSEIVFPTSTLQMFDILFKRDVPQLDHVICETAYYAQPKRKVAIIRGKYKYIYVKETKKEYLYDLDFDPYENHNLVYPEFYDSDRYLWYSTAQCFYYPYWDDALTELSYLRKIKNKMWKNGKPFEEFKNRVLQRAKNIYTRIKLAHPKDNIRNIGK